MAKGKDVCEELKRIRKQIADTNEIDYNPHPCTHEGDCMGTCPACEQEVRYLTHQLDKRRSLGKAVSIVGIATCLTAMAPALTSCVQGEPAPIIQGEPAVPNDTTQVDGEPTDSLSNTSAYQQRSQSDDPIILGKVALDYDGTIEDTSLPE